MLQLPQVLARLPKSLAAGDNGPLAADVYALVKGKKRKRSELAVAVNGEAINLYDVRSPDITISIHYSVPAPASFTCPPCSIRLKHDEGFNQRLTYCSLTDPKPRIQCFTEISGKNYESHGRISIARHDLIGTKSPVVFLNTCTMKMPRTENKTLDIALVVVHEDGAIRCLTENLKEELWISESGSRTNASEIGDTRVLCATMLTTDEARKGILRNREDILAKLQGVGDDSGNDIGVSDLLVILVQSMTPNIASARKTVEMRFYSTRANNMQSKTLPHQPRYTPLEQLVAFPIPDPALLCNDKSSYFIHTGSGILYHSTGKTLRLYDFTGPLPRLTHQIQLKNRIHSYRRLSSSSVILATSANLSVIDTQYRAVLSTMSLEPDPEDSGVSPTTKHSSRKQNTRLLSYFVSLDVIVAIQGRNLLSYQFSDLKSVYAGGYKRARNGKLIDAIGRGIRNSSTTSGAPTIGGSVLANFGTILNEDMADQKWEEVKAQLDVLVSKGNVEEFDTLMAADISILQTESKNKAIHDRHNEPSRQKQRYSRSKLVYLISKIFNVKYDQKSAENTTFTRSTLSIAFLPRNVFQWLTANDCFSMQYIESALKQSAKLKPLARLQPNAIIHALINYDESLAALLSVLESPTFLTARELVYAVRIGIENLRTQDGLPDRKLLTNGEVNVVAHPDTEMRIVNGHSEHDSEPTLLSEKLSNAHQLLRHSLNRLHSFHETDIRGALRTELSQPVLLSFVDFLRMDLAQGGWLSRYIEGEETLPVRNETNGTINIATKLFNCAIDCLGTGGWISGAMNAAISDNVDTIAYMKAEVSAALEGIEEAAYLKGMLNEVLLFSKTVKIRPPELRTEESSLIRPITVAVQTWEDSILPLGLKANQGPSLTKIGAGGEIQDRSMRDVGRLKSRKVGAYSFERITI
ncbi:hypothetical protein MMC18_000986 [Xylographa bjoerkii]|nr:hypothetical protein [Xylographa bjoerkii]